MNVTNTLIPITPIPASAPASRGLFIEFESQPELVVPLTSVHHSHIDPTGPMRSPIAALPVEVAPQTYSHWGINE